MTLACRKWLLRLGILENLIPTLNWNWSKNGFVPNWLWADGRMLADIIRVLVACDDVGRKHYSTSLFPESEALPGSCAARNTFDSAQRDDISGIDHRNIGSSVVGGNV